MEILSRALYTHKEIMPRRPNEAFSPIKDLKVGIKLNDEHIIEAAVFTILRDSKIEKHLCISCQVGCKFGCRFCFSGKKGFLRDMTADEMLDEILILAAEEKVSAFDDIMFMGIGEPLDNFNNVVQCMVRTLTQQLTNKISIASVGIPDKIIRLSNISISPQLWISLHAADDVKRSNIIPASQQYKLTDIFSAASFYATTTNTKVLLNYLLFPGFNDTDLDITNICRLVDGMAHFELMISEPNSNLLNFPKTCYSDILNFSNRLHEFDKRLKTRLFLSKGREIRAGCGEFAFEPAIQK